LSPRDDQPVVIDLLRRAADENDAQPVVVSQGRATTYGECLARAEAFARGLDAAGIERFGVHVSDVAELVALLGGASSVGSEACIYPPSLSASDVADYASRFEHPVVVTDTSVEMARTTVARAEALARDDGVLPAVRSVAPVMILTTGTSGHQRGVRHDWRRLVGAMRHTDSVPGSRWLLAYNVNQMAGVQILLHGLASRATLVVPASNRPRDALRAMQEFGVTHASGTPTLWRVLLGLLEGSTEADPPLQQITMGGEAVPAALIDSLQLRFPRARISQIYGATEFGMGVSVHDGRNGIPLSSLDRTDDADVRLRVIDGQLYSRSRVGMLGYFGEDDIDDGWQPTGDLVELRGDRIHFTGRVTEIINVGGVKVHPLPIEEIVLALDGVELAHAYGRANPVTGQIVALDVVSSPGVDAAALKAQIWEACRPLPPAARPRLIRFVAELDVRGNKIARGLTR